MRHAGYLLSMAAVVVVFVTTEQATLADVPKVKNASVTDVVLAEGGLLNGQLVDTSGKPVANVPVTIYHSKKPVARSTTDSNGVFTIRKLRPGGHKVLAKNAVKVVRLWEHSTAPPASKSKFTMVTDERVVRGQNVSNALRAASINNSVNGNAGGLDFSGFLTPTGFVTTAAVVGSVVLIADAVDDDDDDDEPAAAPSNTASFSADAVIPSNWVVDAPNWVIVDPVSP